MGNVTPNFEARVVNGIEMAANAISRGGNDILNNVITEWKAAEERGDSNCALNKFMYEKTGLEDFMHDLDIVKSALIKIVTNADESMLNQGVFTDASELVDQINALAVQLAVQNQQLAAQNQQLREQIDSIANILDKASDFRYNNSMDSGNAVCMD